MALPLDIDPEDVAATGWGVVFPEAIDPAIRAAVRQLIEHRREGQRGGEAPIKELEYRTGETVSEWLARHGTGLVNVDPGKVPFYLALIGGPESIPFEYQAQLGLAYAVGRICLDTPDEYERYARSVIETETGTPASSAHGLLFAPEHSDDEASKRTVETLIRPMADRLAQRNCDIETVVGRDATKEQLRSLLCQHRTPTVFLTATHGVAFPAGDEGQRTGQGALLCADWVGPNQSPARIPAEAYFACSDVPDEANLLGSIIIHASSYSAGTSQYDSMAPEALGRQQQVAPQGFVASLAQRLMAHRRGGALGVIGAVERIWGPGVGATEGILALNHTDLVRKLLTGGRVGNAMRWSFSEPYATLSLALAAELERIELGGERDDERLAALWTARNDARSYILLGDPAVRLNLRASPNHDMYGRSTTR